MELSEAIREARAFLVDHGAASDVDFQVREFELGWLLSPKSGDEPRFGGIRLIVDRDTRSVHSYPTSEPPEFTIKKYLNFRDRKQ